MMRGFSHPMIVQNDFTQWRFSPDAKPVKRLPDKSEEQSAKQYRTIFRFPVFELSL